MCRPRPHISHQETVKVNDMLQRISIRARRWFGRSDRGQDLLEYALLVALIAMVVATAVSPLGTTIKTVFWDAIATTTGTI